MRLDRITTRSGDDGNTALADGSRVAKDDVRIAALGSLDELNCLLGLLLTEPLPPACRTALEPAQHELFDLGAALATARTKYSPAPLARLDEAIAHLNASLPPLKEFVLPGGNRPAALCHLARSVARRAERDWVHLQRTVTAPTGGLAYLNRLSDLLFILARHLARQNGTSETEWKPLPAP